MKRNDRGKVSGYGVVLELLAFLRTNPPLTPYEQQQADDFLLREQEAMFVHFATETEQVFRLPVTDPYWQASAELAKYLTENFDQFQRRPRSAQKKIYEFIYLYDALTAKLAPAFDGISHGLEQFDAWKAAGHPIDGEYVSIPQQFIVCPIKAVNYYGSTRLMHGDACTDQWYQQMLNRAGQLERFAQYLTEKGTPQMAVVVALNLLESNLDKVLALLRGIETRPEIWAPAWRTMATHAWLSRPSNAVLAESRRIWDMRPELRATVLWGLAQIDRRNSRHINWKGFNSRFGGAVSKELFTEFLKQDPSSPSTAHLLWPTLAGRWSRADLLLPHLDRWLSESQANPSDLGRAEHSWKYTIDAMCLEKNHDDLDKMKQYLEGRIKKHPDEPFRPWLRYMDTRRCGRRAPKKRASDRGERGESLQIVQ